MIFSCFHFSAFFLIVDFLILCFLKQFFMSAAACNEVLENAMLLDFGVQQLDCEIQEALLCFENFQRPAGQIRSPTGASSDEAARLLRKAQVTNQQQLHEELKVTLAKLMRERQIIMRELPTS